MDISAICFILFLYFPIDSLGQDEFVGKFIGSLNSYHNQVGGDVYAVDESTLLIKNFMYDGNGKDTFFWAGTRPRVGPQGFIVPNEYGRTNVLGPYRNKDITITLPGGKTLRSIRWFAIYDINDSEAYGDVQILENFEPPKQVKISKFHSKTNQVASGTVTIIDSKTIQISKFRFNGNGKNAYFWVGIGQTSNPRGSKIPDEHGYMTPLRKYVDRTIVLTLPGDKTVFTIDWLAVFDVDTEEILGDIIIPEDLNVPPSLVTIKNYATPLSNCEQLYKDLQVSWDVFGDSLTMEVTGQMDENDYAAFGISGDPTKPMMIGGDVLVAYRRNNVGYIKDYNMSSYFPCTKVVGQYRGVCEDTKVGGHENLQYNTHTREDGVSSFTFRRRLTSPDSGDKNFPETGSSMIIWALGKLDHLDQPMMHYAWSNVPQTLTLSRKNEKNCFKFTQNLKRNIQSWPTYRLTNVNKVLNASLGPDGGPRGYSAITGQPSATGLSWYINGQLAPEIVLKRDQEYQISVQGGSNPYDPVGYHPFLITNEPHGQYSQLTPEERSNIRVLAGVDYTLKGEPRSSRAGPLCIWKHYSYQDRRRDVDFMTFESYRNGLDYDCNLDSKPGILKIRPNSSWPDVVYYNSWTGRNMGWKMYIIDDGVINTSSPFLLVFSSILLVINNRFVN